MTFAEASGLVRSRARSGVAIDSNLLLPLWVGRHDWRLIASFKRTMKYASPSWDILSELARLIDPLVVTPHVLTEVSNLLGQLPQSTCKLLRVGLAKVLENIDERSSPSHRLAATTCFPRLGLTDAALIELADQGILVLTDDLPLFLEIDRKKRRVIYFTHLLRDEINLR